MGIDGIGGDSETYYEPTSFDPPPSDPPSYEPPPEPAYIPPQDHVDPPPSYSSSADSSAAAWQEQTIATAEAYVAENPPDNGFNDKTAEERAQDAFWKNDPNRPPPAAEPPPQAAAPSKPEPAPKEEDDLDPKNPANKPPEAPADPNAPGPVLPPGPGPVPAWLLPPPPPPPNPLVDFSKPPSSGSSEPPVISTIKGIIDNVPLVPTRTTSSEGTPIYGVRSNPGPTAPSTEPPEKRDPPPSQTPDSKVK
jgi:hypothetical protein